MSGEFLISLFVGIYLLSILCTSTWNPIIAVTSLITIFILHIIYFIYIQLEFFALIFLIIYVGAVSLLIIFIVMMFNLDTVYVLQRVRTSQLWYTFRHTIVFGLFYTYFSKIYLMYDNITISTFYNQPISFFFLRNYGNDINLYSTYIYIQNFYNFHSVNIILIIAVLGTILLTRQNTQPTMNHK